MELIKVRPEERAARPYRHRRGMRIIRAILAGERDPNVLTGLRHYSCHSSAETIAKALTGSYRAEHLFALEQALALYDAYREKASACDVRIEAVLRELSIHRGRDQGAVPPPRRQHRTDQANALAFDVRAALFALLRERRQTDPEHADFVAECMDALENRDLFDSAYWKAKAQRP